MSVKHRMLFTVPVVVEASWIAVRSMAASPARGLDEDPPLALASTSPEFPDPALAELISQFAAEARAAR